MIRLLHVKSLYRFDFKIKPKTKLKLEPAFIYSIVWVVCIAHCTSTVSLLNSSWKSGWRFAEPCFSSWKLCTTEVLGKASAGIKYRELCRWQQRTLNFTMKPFNFEYHPDFHVDMFPFPRALKCRRVELSTRMKGFCTFVLQMETSEYLLPQSKYASIK